MDAEGPIETARQGKGAVQAEDRRADLVVRELHRYNIRIAALQETKWFGSGLYHVGDSVILTSGRKIPSDGEPVQRGKGVALVLSGPAIEAWKDGGKQWKAWGSRLVSAKLQLNNKRTGKLHVLSCYAPTRAASRAEKDEFYDMLQQALDEVPSNEVFILLGDFNARVGSREEEEEDDDIWGEVRGPHGFGLCNDSGKELLAFLARNESIVCNTWFKKKDIHKQTWQHPKSKQWHCIDYAIMRRQDRKRCLDATVRRGAECNTDHQLLCIKVRITYRRGNGAKAAASRKRYDVFKLMKGAQEDGNQATRVSFVEAVEGKVKSAWPECKSGDEKWAALRAAFTESGRTILGTCTKRNPDRFRERESTIIPALVHRNQLYNKWLSTQKQVDLNKFKEARSKARKIIREAKNTWFQAKAEEAQSSRFGGKVVWRCIRDLQSTRRGLRPTRPKAIRDEDGNLCTSSLAQQRRWLNHFNNVLNVQSSFNPTELSRVKQRRVREDLDSKPTEDELITALVKLKNGKAGGNSQILPEMVKVGCGSETVLASLLDLVHTVWEEGKVPRDWSNAVLIPIPKKGNLSYCDNWRGIALLEVIGKVVARVLQARLQMVTEEELPDSQCGFRKARGCSDMIFTVRQLVEKSIEHRSIIYVDLKKAYDSVPREALWLALKKLGIPTLLVELIKSFHEGMKAQVLVNGEVPEEQITVVNGLRQGCTMAPTLFNLYGCIVAERWKERLEGSEGVGICLCHKVDGKLFRRYTKSGLREILTECQFADDVALLAASRIGAEKTITTYMETADDFGLTVSIPKTKLTVSGYGIEEEDRKPIVVRGGEIECVEEFPYLGSVVMSNGRLHSEADRRIASASRAFGALRKAVFDDDNLSLSTKRKVYNSCVLSVLLYGSETWTLLRKHLKRVDGFHHKCIRTVLKITNQQQWEQRITSESVRKKWGDPETITSKSPGGG